MRAVTWACATFLTSALAVASMAAQRSHSDTVQVAGQALVAHRYEPAGTPRCPSVVLLSGDGGWQLGVVEWAERLADLGYEVIGVDATRLVKIAGSRGLAGVVAEWPDLARLTMKPPVLLGYSRGATLGLAFASRAANPPPAVLLGIDLEDHYGGAPVPIGLSPGVQRHGDYVVDLRPLFTDRARTTRLAVIHGGRDRVAPYDSLRPWLAGLPEPKRLTILPASGHGFGDSRVVLPAIRASLEWAGEEVCRP